MKEALRHKEAFEYYYSLGEERSLKSVARQFGVSERSVARWSKAFGWTGRVRRRDTENAQRLAEKTNATVVEVKANYRKIIQAAIATFVRRLKEKEIAVESISDFERLVKMDLLLMGEATERNEVRGDEARERLTRVLDELSARRAKKRDSGGSVR